MRNGVRLENRLRRVLYTDLVVALNGRDDSGTKTSRDADAESPNHTANEEIPDHVLLSPSLGFETSQRMHSVTRNLHILT